MLPFPDKTTVANGLPAAALTCIKSPPAVQFLHFFNFLVVAFLAVTSKLMTVSGHQGHQQKEIKQ
jgi:hypothetical protein